MLIFRETIILLDDAGWHVFLPTGRVTAETMDTAKMIINLSKEKI